MFTPQSHGGSIFFFMKKFTAFTDSEIDVHCVVESTLSVIDNDDDDDDDMDTLTNICNGEPDSDTDMHINCDLVLKDYDRALTTTTTTTESKPNSHSHPYSLQSDFTISSLYHLSDFTDNDLEKSKQLKLKPASKSNMFKPDELGINRSDNSVFRDDEIEDDEKNNWWISPIYYDDNCIDIRIHSQQKHTKRYIEPCMLL